MENFHQHPFAKLHGNRKRVSDGENAAIGVLPRANNKVHQAHTPQLLRSRKSASDQKQVVQETDYIY